MEKVHSGQFLFFQVIQKALPVMEQAADELRTSLAVKDVALPEAEKSLARLTDQIRAIKEATELDRVAVAKIVAGLAQFVEEHQLQRERLHETAALATLQQYYEVAAKGSVPFWVELLGLVDLPVQEQAMTQHAKENPERFLKMLAAANRAWVKAMPNADTPP
jgi:hypothetical protein